MASQNGELCSAACAGVRRKYKRETIIYANRADRVGRIKEACRKWHHMTGEDRYLYMFKKHKYSICGSTKTARTSNCWEIDSSLINNYFKCLYRLPHYFK